MIYVKTPEGQAAFKDRNTTFTRPMRTAFILFDGRRTDTEVLALTNATGLSAAQIHQMVAWGFLAEASAPLPPLATEGHSATGFVPTELMDTRLLAAPRSARVVLPPVNEAARFQHAYALAMHIASDLGPLSRLRLVLAIEGTTDLHQLRKLLPKLIEAAGIDACTELIDLLVSDYVDTALVPSQ